MIATNSVKYNGVWYESGMQIPDSAKYQKIEEKLDIPFYDDEAEETETEYVSESKNKRGRKPKNKVFDE